MGDIRVRERPLIDRFLWRLFGMTESEGRPYYLMHYYRLHPKKIIKIFTVVCNSLSSVITISRFLVPKYSY